MHLASLPSALREALDRPELRAVTGGWRVTAAPALAASFTLAEGELRLGRAALERPDRMVIALRHGLEAAWLGAALPGREALAALAAARVAALFAAMEEGPESAPVGWSAELAAALPPSPARLAALARELAPGAALAAADGALLAALWPLLGPAEWLMEQGGDGRLAIDPLTGLNAYGCSHRPRPWAVTFASSTASSSSERGYAGAEAARRRLVRQGLTDGPEKALAAEAARVRAEIAAGFGLGADAGVIVAASGTDCELFALALAVAAADGRAVVNLLVAPEETGSGVPLAAEGRHFAPETAWQSPVEKGARVAGFPAATRRLGIALRGADGTPRPPAAVTAEIAAEVAQAVADGARVLLHVLDVSKTGLLAPDPAWAGRLAARFPGLVDVVVDACQARLSEDRVRQYVAAGFAVLVTGSKFFTGPPFAGAVLVPPALLARLRAHPLPAGLADYAGAWEWPEEVGGRVLAPRANAGLLLRWNAALAEMAAFRAVPAAERRESLARFTGAVAAAIAASPDLEPVAVPAPDRSDAGWDGLATILSFAVRAPGGGLMGVAEARAVYRWLNADLAAAIPAPLSYAERELARLFCHIGQPVPLAGPGGRPIGALRISAGARLVSGEPSHGDMDTAPRLAREIADANRVLAKISLILRHFNALEAADPRPSFR